MTITGSVGHVPVEVEVDIRDSGEVWIWVGDDGVGGRIEMSRDDVFGILQSLVYLEAQDAVQEWADKALQGLKEAIWEAIQDQAEYHD